jgi:perosamine synthetase
VRQIEPAIAFRLAIAVATNFNPEACFTFYRGRTAMYALLRALKIDAGDEVIIQAYTCLAVPLPILALAAKPIYVDVDPATYSAEPAKVRAAITSRTRAIVVQHTFGIPARLDELTSIARETGVPLLEDCCHAQGSYYRGRPLGSFGVGSFRSLQWSKPLVIGRGGIATVNEPALVAPMRDFHATCIEPPAWETAAVNVEYLAYQLLKGRPILDRIRGAVRMLVPSATGTFKEEELTFKSTRDYIARMPRSLESRLRKKLCDQEVSIAWRSAISRCYLEHLQRLGVSNLAIAQETGALMSYPLLVQDRTAVVKEARRRRIHTDTSFSSPIEPLTSGADWEKVGYRAGSCPVAEWLSSKTITFPIREWVQSAETERVLTFTRELAVRGALITSRPPIGAELVTPPKF